MGKKNKQAKGQSTTPAKKYTPPPPCHTEGTPIFHSPFGLYAGSRKGSNSRAYDLRIDLANELEPAFQGFSLAPALQRFVEKRTSGFMRIPWPDFGIPNFDREDWYELLDAIIDGGYERVWASCFGGHGRTGTFMAIMIAITGNLPDGVTDPVEHVRNIYCKRAVESNEQIRYIEEITGLEVKAGPRQYGSSLGLGPVGGYTGDYDYGYSSSNWQQKVYGSGGKLPTADEQDAMDAEEEYERLLAEKYDDPDKPDTAADGRPLSWIRNWWDG